MTPSARQQPLVSIISVNYNQIEVTGDFLDSVRKLTYSNCEIILVDNGSKVSPGKWIQQYYPEVRFIESQRNLGFSGGNNLGMREARGDYFFFVNNDTVLAENLIETLLETAQSRPEAGIVCPMIMYFDRPELIQYAGSTKMNPVTARNQTIGYKELDKGQFTSVTETSYAHGAAMFVPRRVVEKTGMMPELFFLYYEELDWSALIREAGFSILVQPAGKVFHKESVSTGKMSTLKTYYMNRNRALFMRRHSAFPSLILFWLYWFFVVTPKSVVKFAVKGQWAHLSAFLRGLGWNFTHSSKDSSATASLSTNKGNKTSATKLNI